MNKAVELNQEIAQTSATIHPTKVQPRKIFNIKIAYLLAFLLSKATMVGIK
jgi:hypothetical protein